MTLAEFGFKPFAWLLSLTARVARQASGDHVTRCCSRAVRRRKSNKVLHTQSCMMEEALLVSTISTASVPVGKRGLPMLNGESAGQRELASATALSHRACLVSVRPHPLAAMLTLFVWIQLFPALALGIHSLLVGLISMLRKCLFSLFVLLDVPKYVVRVFLYPLLVLGSCALSTVGQVARLSLFALSKLGEGKDLSTATTLFQPLGQKSIAFYLFRIREALNAAATDMKSVPAGGAGLHTHSVSLSLKSRWCMAPGSARDCFSVANLDATTIIPQSCSLWYYNGLTGVIA